MLREPEISATPGDANDIKLQKKQDKEILRETLKVGHKSAAQLREPTTLAALHHFPVQWPLPGCTGNVQ